MNLNLAIFNLIHEYAGRSRLLDGTAYFFAEILTYLLVLCGLYFLWCQRGWRRRIFAGLEIVLAVLLSRGLITTAIRYFYHELRPFAALNFTPLILGQPIDNSFPSGHMTGLFAFATVLYLLNKKWGSWYLILSLLVGIARIYTGIHWPIDILGGMAIGIVSGFFIHWLVRKHWIELETGAAEIAGTSA